MSSNYENVLWNFGDCNTSIDDNPHNIYANDGFFDIKLTAITNSGCLTDTITKSIFVTSPLNINEVKCLTIDEYDEEIVDYCIPFFDRNIQGIHHLHQINNFFVTDFCLSKRKI